MFVNGEKPKCQANRELFGPPDRAISWHTSIPRSNNRTSPPPGAVAFTAPVDPLRLQCAACVDFALAD